MHSKTLKHSQKRLSQWKVAHACSESQIQDIAKNFAIELCLGDLVFLEGPIGVGKSTFARALLSELEIYQPAEGSPTFAIAHEYTAPLGEVIHIDFFRLNSAQEVEEAGILHYFWERNALIISEWASSWSECNELIRYPKRKNWFVTLNFCDGENLLRDIKIEHSKS